MRITGYTLGALIAALLCCSVASATSPLITNNSFAGDSFASWTATTPTYTGGCGSSTSFHATSALVEDADGGASTGASGAVISCGSGSATIGETQSFMLAGTPVSQTYSFWYNVPQVTAGDPVNCTQGSGSAQVSLFLNGTAIATGGTMDGAWHRVTGSTTALVSGTNTITITASLQSAAGTSQVGAACTHQVVASQPVYIDNIALSASLVGQGWIGSWKRQFEAGWRL